MDVRGYTSGAIPVGGAGRDERAPDPVAPGRSLVIRRAIAIFLPVAVLATLCCGFVYTAVQQDLRMGANDPQLQRLTALVTGGAWLALNTTSPLAPLSASSLMAGTPRSTPGGDDGPRPGRSTRPLATPPDRRYPEFRITATMPSSALSRVDGRRARPPARLGGGRGGLLGIVRAPRGMPGACRGLGTCPAGCRSVRCVQGRVP